MTEQELRALVRQAIAYHLEGQQPSSPRPMPATLYRQHLSHALFTLPESSGPCLIEPAVACNHCGFCKSYGH